MQTQMLLNELYDTINTKFESTLEQLQNQNSNKANQTDQEFEMVKEEIDMKVCEFKKQLDEYADSLKEQVDQFKDECLRMTQRKCKSKSLSDVLQNKIEPKFMRTLSQDFALVNAKSKQNLKIINKLVNESLVNDFKLQFHTTKFDPSCVGSLWFKTNLDYQLKSRRYHEIDLNVEPIAICALNASRLLICGLECDGLRSLNLFDNQFNLIKSIKKLNGQNIMVAFLATNDKNRIYMSEPKNKRVLMTDENLNFIKCYQSDNIIPAAGDCCFHENFLYVCKFARAKICQFDCELEKRGYLEPRNRPLSLRLCKNTAVMSEEIRGRFSISFYEFESFRLMKRYNGLQGSALPLNNLFYFLPNDGKCMQIYNLQGDLKDSISLDYFQNKERKFGCLIEFNGNFIISSSKSKKLLAI